MSSETLTGQQVEDARLDGWAFLLHYGVYGLETRIHSETFAVGLALVASVGEVAEEMSRPIGIDLRQAHVDVRLSGGGDGSGASGITEADVGLARETSGIARNAGTELECASLAHVELAPDTQAWAEIGPFWAAVLSGDMVADGDWADVGDRNQMLPLVWFQPSGNEQPTPPATRPRQAHTRRV